MILTQKSIGVVGGDALLYQRHLRAGARNQKPGWSRARVLYCIALKAVIFVVIG